MGDKRLLLCAVVMFFYVTGSLTAKDAEPTRLYVAGDSEAAIEARRVLAKVHGESEGRACFSVEPEAKSELTLKIGERETSGGLNAMFGLGVNYTTTVVTGQLMDRKGTIIWEDSKQGAAGLVHDGSGAGARNLLRGLWKAQGCTKRGLK